LALAIFFHQVIFLSDVDLFDLVADEFRSFPSEIYNWHMSPLDFEIEKASITRGHIISQHGFKRAWCEAPLFIGVMGQCVNPDSHGIKRREESHDSYDGRSWL
jgi:hypothetical protein